MKKLLASLLAVLLLTAGVFQAMPAHQAEAAAAFTYYAKNDFQARTGPGDHYAKALHVPFQTAFAVKQGAIKNGWAKIQLNGKTLYAKSSYITNKKPAKIYFSYYTKEPVSFYAGRGTHTKRYGSIAEDAIIKVGKGTVLNGWVEILHNGKNYYADYSKLTSKPPVFFTYYAVKDFTLYNERNKITPKKKVSTGSAVKVKKGSVQNGWSRIEYNGLKGYAPYSSIASKPAAAVYFTYYANKNTGIYSTTNTSSGKLASLVLNDQMKIEKGSISNGWAVTSFNGKDAYVPSADISNKPVPVKAEDLTYYVREELNLRSKKTTASSIILTIPRGNKVEILNPEELKEEWISVRYSGKTGFVKTSYLTLEPQPKETALSKTIVLDPGHGGKDPGAIGNGLQEKAVVLDVGKLASDKLKKLGYNAYMTRDNDTFLSLNERTDFTYTKNAGVFVSLHMNASTAASANGTETFATNGSNASAAASAKSSKASSSFRASSLTQGEKDDSAKLAEFIQARLIKALGTRDRSTKKEAFYVIDKNYTRSVLVEMGFISHSGDAAIFKTYDGKNKAAEAITQGVNDFYLWKNGK
ncbi:N-acetylmuramoyl-L-alanine amidase [Metabacillus sp. JX24]|uniref:N-acetylmuramoyl-L-alanine amidase n=1 Tax=Metabacillus sp. JX24 TaxID=3240759 RepID=UPI0035103C05